MASGTSIKSSKSSKSQGKQKPKSSSNLATPKNSSQPERKDSRRLSAQILKYDEKDGFIQVKDIEGTALDSDEYYEYLYEDLIDSNGATASKLVSNATVKLKFDEDRNEICELCNLKFADCPHIVTTELLPGEKTDNFKVRVRKKKKKDDDTK